MPTKPRAQRVAVIGAGLGGISAAISLAIDGFPVDVYEKNSHVGGKLNVVRKDGFTFDTGPSILTLPGIFRRLFERAGRSMEDYVRLREVTPHWRNFFEDGTTIDLSPDLRLMEQELVKLPPEDRDGFFRFLAYSRRLLALTEKGYFARGLDSFWELVRFYGLRESRGFDALRSVDQGVARFVGNPKLRDILNYFIKYVGSSPYDAPALLNLMPYVQFGHGLWYVEGGMHTLGQGLRRLADELGVAFHLGTEIRRLETTGNQICALVTADEKRLPADVVVSNMEVLPAYRKLLGEKPSFMKGLARFAPSCSGLVLHLGINRLYPQLAHHNIFYSANAREHFDCVFHKQTLSSDPTIYLVAPCKTDPAQAPTGCEVIKALPHIPHLSDEHPLSTADYAAFRETVLVKLERMGLKDLRRHIICEDLWTPKDIAERYGSNKGSIYGVVSDRFKNLGFKAPQRSTKYRNLYFVGGSVNPGGGMPMVVLSGQNVRDKIVADLAR